MEERKIKRGDIYRADLTPVVGSEQGGSRRPVLIISNNIGNKHSPTVIITAITGLEHAKANLPTHIIVKGFEKFEKDFWTTMSMLRRLYFFPTNNIALLRRFPYDKTNRRFFFKENGGNMSYQALNLVNQIHFSASLALKVCGK